MEGRYYLGARNRVVDSTQKPGEAVNTAAGQNRGILIQNRP